MDYPILENGREIGRLYARQDGLYTVFEARLPPRESLTRLYLSGGGESRLLGVMEPRQEGCFLCRRLSRREMPHRLQYASTVPDGRQEERETTVDGVWEAGENGILYDRKRGLIAFPARLPDRDGQLRIEVIGGKEYIVFRW